MRQRAQGHPMTWIMWGLVSFFYAYQYILRVLPNLMILDILEKFHIDAALFGQYSGLYYIGYAGMHIPVGILLDKYGPKWVLPGCILLTVIGLLPLLYATHWIYPGLGRLLMGMGSSAAILGVFKVIRICFPEDKFAFVLGCSVTIGLLGAIYGGQPVNVLVHLFGWNQVLYILIFLGIGLALANLWILPAQAVNPASKGWLGSIKSVLGNPSIILICLFSGCMVGPLEGFADVWGKEYLKTAYQLSESTAAALPSLIFVGMCFGSPFLSWISQKTKSYFGVIILSAFVMGGSFILLLTCKLPLASLTILFVTVGVFCAYQILAIYQTSTYVKEELVGLTTAYANMIIMIFGYFFHTLIGKIIAIHWDGQAQAGGTPLYDLNAFTQGLTVIPLGLIVAGIGFVCLVFSKKKKSPPLVYKGGRCC